MSAPYYAEQVIKWAVRLLYLTMFLVLVISFNLWSIPYCLPYLMAILILLYTGIEFASKEAVWSELDDRYLEDISGFYTHPPSFHMEPVEKGQ